MGIFNKTEKEEIAPIDINKLTDKELRELIVKNYNDMEQSEWVHWINAYALKCTIYQNELILRALNNR